MLRGRAQSLIAKMRKQGRVKLVKFSTSSGKMMEEVRKEFLRKNNASIRDAKNTYID